MLNNNFYIPQTGCLKNIFRSAWQVRGATSFQRETILPKGNIELIFNLGEEHAISASLGGKQFQLAKCFVNGFNTAPIKLQLPEQHVFFGVQLHPVAIQQLLGMPANEFFNRIVDLSLINQSFTMIWEQLACQHSFNERVNTIAGLLQHKTAAFQPRESFINDFLVKDLAQTISVTDLAKKMCYSTRQLSRKMIGLTGLNTEDMLLYKKYLRSINLMQQSGLSLTAIAYESHFTDQSHFIKTFKSFTQLTPTQYRQSKSLLPGHIFEHVR